MERPEVTVVIPTHNRCKLLERALDCALRQVDVELEVAVIDDGSTDDTASALSRLDDRRTSVIRHDTPQGVARARNAGVATAQGKWIAFLDDDDLWSPLKLRSQLDVAGRTAASMVYGTSVALDGRNAVKRILAAPPAETLARSLLLTNVIGGPSGVMAHADLIRRVGCFDVRLSALADWDLWLRLAHEGQAAPCPAVVAAYVEHGANMMVVDAKGMLAEFDYLSSKHRAAAEAEGVDFGDMWRARWTAAEHLRSERPIRAAAGYLRRAVKDRRAAYLARAVGALMGVRAQGLGQRIVARRTPEPDWLRHYR